MRSPRLRVPWRPRPEQLRLRVRGEIPELVRTMAARRDSPADLPAVKHAAGEYRLALEAQWGDDWLPVTAGLAGYWGADTLWRPAIEQGRRSAQLKPLRPRLLTRKNPVTAATLLCLRSLPDEWAFPGGTLLLAPTDLHTILVGADDVDALLTAAEQSRTVIEKYPYLAVSVQPLVWRDGWQPAEWPQTWGWRQRQAGRRLAAAVDELRAAFGRSLEDVQESASRYGSVTRERLGCMATGEQLEGWTRLATAFELPPGAVAAVTECARDAIGYFDAHADRLAPLIRNTVTRYQFGPEHVLAQELERAGSLVTLDRKSDPVLIAEDVAATPAAAAAGARVETPDRYDDIIELAAQLAAGLDGYGVRAVHLEAGEANWLVTFPKERGTELLAAQRQTGEVVFSFI